MISKNALLRGAALGAMFAVATATAASAETKPVHKKKVVHAAATYGAAPSEMSELRTEVQQLKATVEAQAQAQAALQAQIAQQQAQVAQVAADSESVQAQLDSVPQQILTTVGELPKPKPSWAEKTQISGRVYFDATNISQKNNGQSVAPSGSAFEIKRMYIGIDHQFNDVYSANLTTDFQYNSTLGATELYIKKAYLQAKYFPWLTLRAGSADLPWIPFVEDIYGYRHIEQTLIDRTKFGTSADWGFHALGSFDPLGSPTGPVVSYALAVIDGTGYKAPPGTGSAPRTDTLDVEGRVSAKWMDFTAAIGGYTGRLGKDAGATFNAPIAANAVRHDASRFNALLAYTGGPWRLGAEYFSAENWTAVTSVAKDKADGYSLFGSYQFDPMWSVFGKYEYVKPNKDTIAAKKDNYFNVGIDYRPVQIVDLALVYKRDKVDNGTFSTGNGTIGGALQGTYDEVGLFGQFRW
jgi:hypothetical protein